MTKIFFHEYFKKYRSIYRRAGKQQKMHTTTTASETELNENWDIVNKRRGKKSLKGFGFDFDSNTGTLEFRFTRYQYH